MNGKWEHKTKSQNFTLPFIKFTAVIFTQSLYMELLSIYLFIFNLEVTPLDENDTMLLYGDMGNYSIGGFQFKFKVMILELGKWL